MKIVRCPHCGEQDRLYAYSQETSAVRVTEWGKEGEVHDAEWGNGELIDTQITGFHCEGCGKDFSEPDIDTL